MVAYAQVTITGTVTLPAGAAQMGTVSFTPIGADAIPIHVVDSSGHTIIAGTETQPIVGLNISLPATDSADLSPTNFAYEVTIRAAGYSTTFTALLPTNPAAVTLDELVPIPVGNVTPSAPYIQWAQQALTIGQILQAQQNIQVDPTTLGGKYAPLSMPGYVVTRIRPNQVIQGSSFYNFKANTMKRLRAGLGRARSGGHSTHVVLAASDGAGCTQGVTAPFSFDRLNAWPIAMRNALARRGMPIAGTGWIQATDGNHGNDARLTGSTGAWFATQLNFLYTVASGATLTFTPDMGGSHVSVWIYDPGTGGGSYPLFLSINGVNIGAGFTSIAGPATWRIRTIAAQVNAGDAVTLTAGANGAYVGGIRFWAPLQGGIEVHNLSQSGSTASGVGGRAWGDIADNNALGNTWLTAGGASRTIADGVLTAGQNILSSATANFTDGDIGREIFVPATGGVFNLLNNTAIITGWTSSTQVTLDRTAVANANAQTVQVGADPDCVHISLGANDLAAGVTAATVNAAITAIAAVYPNSDVILQVIAQPAAGLVPAATYDAWASTMYDLADTLNLALIDSRDRQGTFADNTANHVMGDNLAHQLPAAFQSIGGVIAERLVA